MLTNTELYIFPTEKAAERERRKRLAILDRPVWLGENITSLNHWVEELAHPQKKILNRRLQKHLMFHILKNTELKYFAKQKIYPSLASLFLQTIRTLKSHQITPDQLEAKLKEAGTLKEYDLLQVYRSYEERKQGEDWLDAEDLFGAAEDSRTPFVQLREIRFENFTEIDPALQNLIDRIKIANPKLKISFPIPSAQESFLIRSQFLSFRSPYQETSWFLKQIEPLLAQNIRLEEIGIIMGGPARYYEPIWQRLRHLQLVEGPFPFLTRRETLAGQQLLKKTEALTATKGTLTEWLDHLLRGESSSEWSDFFQPFYFSESLASLGKLSHGEFLLWLKDALGEPPPRPIKESLQGIQWLTLREADFTGFKTLWVPGLIEGKFAPIVASPFFRENFDRARPDWKPLIAAFPEPRDLLKELHRMFQISLSQAEEIWLTYPRLDSLGKDLAPSNLTWMIGKEEPVQEPTPFFLLQEIEGNELEIFGQKLKIETERLHDQYQTKRYHADFTDDPLHNKLAAAQPDYIFSPSQLETFAACPFKFYARKVLGIPQTKEYSPQVDAEDIGTLVHAVLERLMIRHRQLFVTARTDREQETKLLQLSVAIFDEVFADLAKEVAYAHPQLLKNLKEKMITVIQELLRKELEEGRTVATPLTPSELEWAFGTTAENCLELPGAFLTKPPSSERGSGFASPSEGGAGVGLAQPPIKLSGRIDRIDRDEKTKRFLILDYKTGQTDRLKDKLTKGIALQLPIYLCAVKTLLYPDHISVGGLLVATRSGEKKAGMVDQQFNEIHFLLGKRATSLLESETFQTTMQNILEKVGEYVAQIRSGDFAARPKDCLPSCDYKEICRYAYKPV